MGDLSPCVRVYVHIIYLHVIGMHAQHVHIIYMCMIDVHAPYVSMYVCTQRDTCVECVGPYARPTCSYVMQAKPPNKQKGPPVMFVELPRGPNTLWLVAKYSYQHTST